MRGTRTIAMAAAYQARADSEMLMLSMFEESYGLSDIRVKRRAGEALTDLEQMRLTQTRLVRFV